MGDQMYHFIHLTLMLFGNDVIKRDPVGFPWKICKRTCAIGSVFGVFSWTSAYYLPFSSPFPGYLPLSRHLISTFNKYAKVCCFRGHVWWRHFRSKAPTRADIAGFPVHPSKEKIVRTKEREPVEHAQNTLSVRASSGDVRHGNGRFWSRNFRWRHFQ
jgi:hypothetical protein